MFVFCLVSLICVVGWFRYVRGNWLKRQNMRNKNPQLVAQHSLQAGSMFRVFHLSWSASVINLLRNKNICCRLKNYSAPIGRFARCKSKRAQICCMTSCEFDEKRATKPKFVAQSRPALSFMQQLRSTRNKCFCCRTSWSRKVKNVIHRPKICNETMSSDKLRVFASRIPLPLDGLIVPKESCHPEHCYKIIELYFPELNSSQRPTSNVLVRGRWATVE